MHQIVIPWYAITTNKRDHGEYGYHMSAIKRTTTPINPVASCLKRHIAILVKCFVSIFNSSRQFPGLKCTIRDFLLCCRTMIFRLYVESCNHLISVFRPSHTRKHSSTVKDIHTSQFAQISELSRWFAICRWCKSVSQTSHKKFNPCC